MAGGQRGGKQQRLPPRRDLGDDAAQIVDKAHVEHPVGLVEDQHLDVGQIDEALLHEVEQPPGRGDQDVDAVRSRLALAATGRRRRRSRLAARPV